MARTRQEINPKCGDRLKGACKKHGIKQASLSELVHISQNTISGIAKGNKPLTYYVASEIVKAFPGTRIEWLMGIDDYETENDRIHAFTFGGNGCIELIEELMRLHGYEVVADVFDYEPPDENGRKPLHYGIKSSDGCIYCEQSEIMRIFNEINDFVHFKCSFLLNSVDGQMKRKSTVAMNYNKQEGENNG